MRSVRLALVALMILGAGLGCGRHATSPNPPAPPPPPPPPPPPAGSAIVSLGTPNADDGAVIVTLHGPGFSELQSASSGYLFYSRLGNGQDAHVIVVGNISAGPLFSFKVAAGSALSAYTVAIEQVASRADALRANTANYSLTVSAAP